jgi:hypothetical protein
MGEMTVLDYALNCDELLVEEGKSDSIHNRHHANEQTAYCRRPDAEHFRQLGDA